MITRFCPRGESRVTVIHVICTNKSWSLAAVTNSPWQDSGVSFSRWIARRRLAAIIINHDIITRPPWQGASGIPPRTSLSLSLWLVLCCRYPCFALIVSAHLRTRGLVCVCTLPPPVYKCLRHVAFNVSDLSRLEFCRGALPSTSQPCVPFLPLPLLPFVAVINTWWRYVVAFRTRPRTSTFFSRAKDTRGCPAIFLEIFLS